MSTHTPGPWVIKFRNDHSAYISMGDPAKGPHKQFDIDFSDFDPSDVADARLIAAAPELLEFAQEFLDACANGMGGESYLRRMAEAVHAKAIGASA